MNGLSQLMMNIIMHSKSGTSWLFFMNKSFRDTTIVLTTLFGIVSLPAK